MSQTPETSGTTATAASRFRLTPAEWALVLLAPGMMLVDTANGAFWGGPKAADSGGISPGEVIRGLLTVWLVLLALRASGVVLRRLRWQFLFLGVWGLLGASIAVARGGGFHNLLLDAERLTKALYAPALVMLYVILYRRYGIALTTVLRAVAGVGLIAGASICVFNLIGVGNVTYEWSRTGFKGLFISQNDVGLAMGISLFSSVALLFIERRPSYLGWAGPTIAGMILLGSRAAALGAILIPLATIAVFWRSVLGGRGRRAVLVAALLVLTVGAAAWWGVGRLQGQRFQEQKYARLAESGVILVRGILLKAGLVYTFRRPWPFDLIGDGPTAYSLGLAHLLGLNLDNKLAEVDWLDFFGAYGLPFVIVIYGFYWSFFRRARSLGLRSGVPLRRVGRMMIGWFMFHSAVAGHAMAGPIPGGTIAPLLALIWCVDYDGVTARPGTDPRERALVAEG